VGPKDQPVASKDQPIAPEIQRVKLGPPFFKTASILNAKFLDKGTYYFPGKKGEEFELDLSKFPMLEFKDGTMIIFSGGSQIKEPDLSVLKSYWSGVNVVSILPDASMEQILDSVFNVIKKEPYVNQLSFSNHGVKAVVSAKWITDKPYTTEKKRRHVCITLIEDLSERTPDSISRYLDQHGISIIDILVDNNETKQGPEIIEQENHIAEDVITINPTNLRAFVNDLVTVIGFKYAKNIKITFPYSGIQVEAISNLVTTKDGRHLLIDFEDLYGDAITSIQKTGFDIIQVKKKDNPYTIIQNLLTGTGVSYTNDPTFFAAKRPVTYNTALTIRGFLVTNTGSRTLLEKEWNKSDSSSSKLQARKGKMLLAASHLHEKVIQFLKNEGVRIIMIGAGKPGTI
jgi:predicted regulator of amino acid metabolism with ACT domain